MSLGGLLPWLRRLPNGSQVGGLGIPLIRAMMDQISDYREGDQNIFRVTVRVPR
jgi:anti-sigma regulatory factor (Ser/Thr protein kinase)